MKLDSHESNQSKGTFKETLQEVSPYFTMGIQLGLTVVAFFFIGLWFDRKFHSDPWGKILATALGFTGGMLHFFKTIKEVTNKTNGK
ncbi:MAG: AtpZ/AtpI family protein [Bacteroidetes bacterium]|nr:AtpZ/AtpI family protein [Bacteroidota bacterium]